MSSDHRVICALICNGAWRFGLPIVDIIGEQCSARICLFVRLIWADKPSVNGRESTDAEGFTCHTMYASSS